MKQILLTILTALALTAEAATNAVRVEFPLESFFGGGKYVKGIKLQAVNPLLGDGATWYAGSTLSVLPQGGTNPIVSLAPNDYWLTFGDITNRLRLMVPYSTGLLNAVDLVTNGVSLYYPLTITANGLTNGQTNVTLSGTFSGDGSGLTGTGISSNTVQGMIDTGTQGATNPVPGWITAATASLLATNGNGGQLTNLNPNAITNAPWLSSTSNAWTGAFTGTASGVISGDGSGLSGLTAANFTDFQQDVSDALPSMTQPIEWARGLKDFFAETTLSYSDDLSLWVLSTSLAVNDSLHVTNNATIGGDLLLPAASSDVSVGGVGRFGSGLFATNLSGIMSVTTNGVGINRVTSPNATLDVSGGVYASGAITAGGMLGGSRFVGSGGSNYFSGQVVVSSYLQASNLVLTATGASNYIGGDATIGGTLSVSNIIASGTFTGNGSGLTNLAGVLNVLEFGADPLGTSQSSSAFVSALSVATNQSKAVFVPAGTYLLTNTIYWPDASNVRLFGQGMGVSRLVFRNTDANDYGILFPTSSLTNCEIASLSIVGETKTNLSNGVILGNGNRDCRLVAVEIRTGYGIAIMSATVGGNREAKVLDCKFSDLGPTSSGIISVDGDDVVISGNWIYDSNTNLSTMHGIYWAKGNNALITENHLFGTNAEIQVYSSAGVWQTNLTISRNVFIGPKHAMPIYGMRGGLISENNFVDAHIYMQDCSETEIKGNQFLLTAQGTTRTGLRASAVTNCAFIANVFRSEIDVAGAIGLVISGNSESPLVSGNTFIGNDYQCQLTGGNSAIINGNSFRLPTSGNGGAHQLSITGPTNCLVTGNSFLTTLGWDSSIECNSPTHLFINNDLTRSPVAYLAFAGSRVINPRAFVSSANTAALTITNWIRSNVVFQVDGQAGTGLFLVNSNGSVSVGNTLTASNLVLSTPVWDDVRLPLSSMRVGAAAPSPTTFLGNTRVQAFADSAEQSLEFELQTPHGINTNNTYGIRLHLHWTSPSAITGVVWGVEYTLANPSGTFGTTVTNLVTVTNSTPYKHNIVSLATITNTVESAVIVGRVFRQNDSASGDAYGLSLDAHVPRNRLGSSAEMGDY